jgi:hypothetical protein
MFFDLDFDLYVVKIWAKGVLWGLIKLGILKIDFESLENDSKIKIIIME